MNFKEFLENWQVDPKDSLRELNDIIQKHLRASTLQDLSFEFLGVKQEVRGKRINTEMTVLSKTEMNIQQQLKNLLSSMHQETTEKGIYLMPQTNKLDKSQKDSLFVFKCPCAVIQVDL